MRSSTCWSLSLVLEFWGSRIVLTGARRAQSHIRRFVTKFPAKPQRRKETRKRMQFISWISLCNLCVLCVSVVIGMHDTTTTETQRTQRLHRDFAESNEVQSITIKVLPS